MPYKYDPSKRTRMKCDDVYLIKLGVKVDKETMRTVPDESDKVNLVELIQSYKDSVGIDAILRGIQSGQIDPAMIADNGKMSGDIADLPDNLNEAYQRNLAKDAAIQEIAAGLGIDPSTINAENYSQVVTDAIAARIKAAQEQTSGAKQEETK